MVENQFSIGDRVAHKHYPEKAIGEVVKFYDSGRVGVDDGCRPRSFLPNNLVLIVELPPAQVEELGDAIAHSQACPECNSYDVSKDDLFNYYWCGNCHHVWETEVEELSNAIATQSEAIATQSSVIELPPIPRDFSELNMPEWWERPILPDFHECNCGDHYDEDDDEDLDWVQETYGVDATYRGWKLTINDGCEIYATPPSGNIIFHCECELNLDDPDGQVALAQDFIDSWYFAQPSPGQLSLNIPKAVARDPPPRFK